MQMKRLQSQRNQRKDHFFRMARVKQKVLDEVKKLYDNVQLFKDEKELKKLKGKWNTKIFPSKNPIILEIGMGNGGFLAQLIAFNEQQVKSFNYIGIEVREFRLWKALRKNKKSVEVGVLKLIATRAQNLKDYFKKGEIQTIYLNFSDPWPKNKHERHRLTSPSFLELYYYLLGSKGELIFKHDNEEFYLYSLHQLKTHGFKVVETYPDYHTTNHPHLSLQTEYESKWLKKGKKIGYIRAVKA